MHETGAWRPLCASEQERLRQASARSARAGEPAPSLPPTTGPGGPAPPWSRPFSALSGLPDHPLGLHPSPGLMFEEHRRAASVCVPRCPAVHSRQARPPALSARAPSAPCSREPASFLPEAQVPSPEERIWMPCSFLSSCAVTITRGKEALKAGKPHGPGGRGPASSPPLTPDLASSSWDMGLLQDV